MLVVIVGGVVNYDGGFSFGWQWSITTIFVPK